MVVAFSEGIEVVDTAVSGIGGCPYANGASGNVATEDVLYLCELLGIEHRVDIRSIMETGNFIFGVLNRESLSKVTIEDLECLEERRAKIKSMIDELHRELEL